MPMKLNKYIFVSLLILSLESFSMESGGETCAELVMPIYELKPVEEEFKNYIGNNNVANKALDNIYSAIEAKQSQEKLGKLFKELENVCQQEKEDPDKFKGLAINYLILKSIFDDK